MRTGLWFANPHQRLSLLSTFVLELYVKTGMFCGLKVTFRCQLGWVEGYLEHH
jgi:hypothetical protein